MPRYRDEVLRTGEVSVERDGKRYTARYDVLSAGRGRVMVRLQSGQATSPIGSSEKLTARILLGEVVDGGHAEEQGIRVESAK